MTVVYSTCTPLTHGYYKSFRMIDFSSYPERSFRFTYARLCVQKKVNDSQTNTAKRCSRIKGKYLRNILCDCDYHTMSRFDFKQALLDGKVHLYYKRHR